MPRGCHCSRSAPALRHAHAHALRHAHAPALRPPALANCAATPRPCCLRDVLALSPEQAQSRLTSPPLVDVIVISPPRVAPWFGVRHASDADEPTDEPERPSAAPAAADAAVAADDEHAAQHAADARRRSWVWGAAEARDVMRAVRYRLRAHEALKAEVIICESNVSLDLGPLPLLEQASPAHWLTQEEVSKYRIHRLVLPAAARLSAIDMASSGLHSREYTVRVAWAGLVDWLERERHGARVYAAAPEEACAHRMCIGRPLAPATSSHAAPAERVST